MSQGRLAAGAAVLSAAAITSPAHATFVLDTSCGVSSCPSGTRLIIDDASKNVSTFTGTVGRHLAGPPVAVDTTGNLDTEAGFATITPTKGGTRSELIFTTDYTLLDIFWFRGQPEPLGFAGIVNENVTDEYGVVWQWW